jgi:heme exporter protein CcmD
MLSEGAHWDYVILAYVATLSIMGALVWLSLRADRAARRDLEAMEMRMQGHRRRPSR